MLCTLCSFAVIPRFCFAAPTNIEALREAGLRNSRFRWRRWGDWTFLKILKQLGTCLVEPRTAPLPAQAHRQLFNAHRTLHHIPGFRALTLNPKPHLSPASISM